MALGKDLGIRGIRRIQNFPVQSGATFKQGDFLTQTLTGVAGPPTPGSNYPVSTNLKIVGRACCDSTGSDGVAYASVPVEVAETGTQFCISLYHSTPASAVPAAAQLVPGTNYELRNTAAGYPAVDLTATTNPACRIVEPDPNDTPSYPGSFAVTTPGANVWVEFVRAATANPGAI